MHKMLRRDFIKLLTFCGSFFLSISPLRAFAEWNRKAFSATGLDEALEEAFPGKEIAASDRIIINVHPVIENGAVVPIKISTSLPDANKIAIFVAKNPNPLIASFDLSAQCKGFVATRIKIGEPSKVIAVVQSGESLYKTDVFVEVIEGGCA